MTPDKDGWCYWSPGQEKPNADDICDVEWLSLNGGWHREDLAPVPDWTAYERRYRLKEKPMSPKVGDEVILKPMKVIEVHEFCVCVPGYNLIHNDDIAQIIPAKREFKPGDRVIDTKDDFTGTIIAVFGEEAWIVWGGPGQTTVEPLSDLQHMEDGE